MNLDNDFLNMTGIVAKIAAAFGVLMNTMLAVALAVMVDSAPLIVTTYIMLALNLTSGWMLMWRTKEKWDEQKWFRTCMKLLWFPLVIMATKWLESSNGIDLSITAFAAGVLSINEFKSFIGNVGTLTGTDIWTAISERLPFTKKTTTDGNS